MVFIKHNSQKPDIFFNPIFIPGFSGSKFSRVRVQGPGSGCRVWVQGPDPGSGSRVQGQGPGFRSSRWIVLSLRKGVFKNFANFTGKQLCGSLFLWSYKLPTRKVFKNRLQHKCFPVKFERLLRTAILKNICKRLLLDLFYKKAFPKNCAIFTGRK